MIRRLRDYIHNKGINFSETFTKKLTLKIKKEKGAAEDCQVVKVSELMKFMDRE